MCVVRSYPNAHDCGTQVGCQMARNGPPPELYNIGLFIETFLVGGTLIQRQPADCQIDWFLLSFGRVLGHSAPPPHGRAAGIQTRPNGKSTHSDIFRYILDVSLVAFQAVSLPSRR